MTSGRIMDRVTVSTQELDAARLLARLDRLPGSTLPRHLTLIIGIGIGADLAIVSTYIGELAPRGSRARYTAMVFV